MTFRNWKWITSANLFKWLSSDKAAELREVHRLSDKKLAEAWMKALSLPNEADILTLEAAARFYASVKYPRKPKA